MIKGRMLASIINVTADSKSKNKMIAVKPFYAKRIFDVIVSIILLPIAIPLILFGAIAMMFTSRGPAFFTQQRVGLKGKPFTLLKLRTMVHSKEGYINHTVKNDARITKAGAILRKTKIDELPQLINVLKGDMSLIGPRPERVEIVEQYKKLDNNYNLRHLVRPGITGWAQVNKPMATPEQNLEKLEYDLFYINNYSVKLDVKILAKTVGVVKKMESL